MFSRSDAQALRARLPEIAFTNANADDADNALLQAYRAHYGLDFEDLKVPIEHCIGTFSSGDYTLVGQYFGLSKDHEKGCALLLHGYFDHAGLFSHLIRHCLEQGHSVLIFDFPGHGLSTGSEASIDSFLDYVDALQSYLRLARACGLQPRALIGQSTGAAIVMDSLLNRPAELTGIEKRILLCPLLFPVKWNSSSLLFYFLRLFTSSSPRRFAPNSHDEAFLNFLKTKDALQSSVLPVSWVAAMIDYQRRFAASAVMPVPIEIIQGTGDETVDWQRNLKLIGEKFPQATTQLIEGAKHHLVNESVPYREQVFEKIAQILNSG